MKRKQGLLFFISSCIPGCGQMHQGYMKRGMSLLTVFCGIFAIAAFLNIGALTALMVPVWLYAFFDSYNLRTQLDGGTAPADAFLLGLDQADGERMALLCRKRHSLVGWGLVALGVCILYTTVAGWVVDFLGQFFDSWWLYSILLYDVPRLAVTIGIIALGIWFIRGPKAPPAGDIPAFTPPQTDQEDGHGED